MLFPTQYIYILNIVVVFVFVLFTYSGYRQGFLLKLLGILGFFVSSFLSWWLSYPLSNIFTLYPKALTPLKGTLAEPLFYDLLNRITLFVVLFISLGILVILLKPILKMLGKLPVIAQVNTLLGTVFGFIQGLILVMSFVFVLSTPLFANGNVIIESSFLKPLQTFTNHVLFFANDTLEQLQSIQKIVTPSTELTQEDLTNIKEWLLSYDLNEIQVDTFINEIAGDL